MALTPAEERELAELERREAAAKATAPTATAPTATAPASNATPSTKLERFGAGMADPIHGGAQFLTNILPEGVVQAGNKLNNWMADKGLPVARIPEGGVNEMVANREQQYQDERAAAGSEGVDWMRLLGNVASPVNAAVASRIPAAGSLATRMAGGATGGVALSALAPTEAEGDEYWPEKGKQLALGAVAGGATPAVTGAVARIVKPKSSADVQKLLKEGVKLTPGQMLGQKAARLEEAWTSLPFAGDPIKEAQRRGIESFNRSAINRALTPIGSKLPKGVNAGHEAIDFAIDTLGNAYDDLLPKMSGQLDDSFKGELVNVVKMGQNMAPEQAGQLKRIVQNEIVRRFTKDGKATGTVLKDIQSKLGGLERTFGKSENYDVRNLGQAVKEVQASLTRMIERSNPSFADDLAKINQGYANLLRVQTAAARQGSKEGVFTAAQLRSAVRALDPSKGKRAFARGQAPMQDLAEAGQNVLAQKVPDSGTPLRLLASNPATGGLGALGALGTGAAYSSPAVKLSELAIAARPSASGPISNAIRRASPFITPALIPGTGIVKDYGP